MNDKVFVLFILIAAFVVFVDALIEISGGIK